MEHLEKLNDFFRLKRSQGFTLLVAIHTLNRCWRARKPTCEEQKDRTSPTSGRLLVEDRSSLRCSWKKDWYSARQASISPFLIHPRSERPSNKRQRADTLKVSQDFMWPMRQH